MAIQLVAAYVTEQRGDIPDVRAVFIWERDGGFSRLDK